MTIGGALSELNNLLKADDIPVYYKPSIKAVMDTITLSISEKSNKWIPVKWHEITDEEREREGYPKDWACYLDNIMPYDGQRILITTKGGFVELDECYSDDGCTFSLDSGYDWIDDVIAWCELPEPYQPQIPTSKIVANGEQLHKMQVH